MGSTGRPGTGVRPERAARSLRPVVLAVVLAVLAAVVPGLVGSTSDAATKRSITISRTLSASSALTGDAIRVSGHVSLGRTGSVIALQRYVGGRWTTYSRSRLTSGRAYHFTVVRTVASVRKYRVYSPTDSYRKAAATHSFTLSFVACTPLTKPANGTAAWFARPYSRTTSPIATQLSRLFCSAANGSTVDVGMYFIRGGSGQKDANVILTALQRVHRYRAVKVRIVMEGRLYRPGAALAPSLTELKKFATVRLCNLGCHNERYASEAKGAIMHHKFVAISDMRWSRTVDPAVVVSSANWSQSQLRYKWQSAVLDYNDPALFQHLDTEYRVLDTCSVSGCAAWAATVARLAIAPAYALSESDRLWHDADSTWRQGTAGRGISVAMSPWLKRDMVATRLRKYTCTPEHHTVRVGHMFLTSARTSVIAALSDLRQRGCVVQVVLGLPDESVQSSGIRALREVGLRPYCTARVHDKIILLDAVRVADGRPDQVVLMGSQSLGKTALRGNDEEILAISTAAATGASVTTNTGLWNAFNKQWWAIHDAGKGCPA